MSHAVFTIVTEVRDGHEAAVRELLDRIERDHAGNGLIAFPAFERLHFASFTLFPPDRERPGQRWLLVFEHNADGTWREHLSDLIASSERGLREIYQHCEGFPDADSQHSLWRYLSRHVRKPNLHHVGAPYRRAATIRADLAIRTWLDDRADALAQAGPPASPVETWNELRAHHPPLPLPEPRASTRARHWLTALALFALAWIVLGAAVRWLWPSPVWLSAALIALFVVHGLWTALLVGWPVFSWERERRPGEKPDETRRALVQGWRTTVNIWIWFAVVGWTVSLIPPAFRLAGIHLPWTTRWPSALALALVAIVALVFLAGQWSLPTPELARRKPSREQLLEVTDQEDHRVINHMSAMVVLRPGGLRRIALCVLLWTLDKTWFHTVLPDRMKGRLFNFSTVHFAQWVVLDQDRYIFLSNYDHSFSRYLDDFGNISFGLARLWGMAAHTPGLSNLERFKDFARTWMTPYSVWYAAYPTTAIPQVWNNEALRRGLAADPRTVDPARLLQRLVNAGER